MNFFKSEPEKCKIFLSIIGIVVTVSIRTNFVVLDGTFINLAETSDIKDQEIVDHGHPFLKHSLRAIKFSQKNDFIRGNLIIKDNADKSEIKKISEQRMTSKQKCYKCCALDLHKDEKIFIYENELPWDKFCDDETLIRREKEE
uniref:TNase-like domain-containing protein n=1 Tax=Strongyloides venezuelensis TaxID=75913 RepID=A0A0K0FI98_STRVS